MPMPPSAAGFFISEDSSPLGEVCKSCSSTRIGIARSILTFFALNIVAHAITMTKRPGQKLGATLWAALTMILSPIVARAAYSRSFISVLLVLSDRWRNWDTSPQLEQQSPSGSVRSVAPASDPGCVDYCFSARQVLRSIRQTLRHWNRTTWRFIKRVNVTLFGDEQDDWGLQSAIDCGAVAIEAPPTPEMRKQARDLHWGETLSLSDNKALWSDGYPLKEDEACEYWYVPTGTRCQPGSSPQLQVAAKSSLSQTVITIGQLVYSSIELYSSWSSSVRQNGLASPFVPIVPYLVGSFLNLIINTFVVSYPYVVVICPRDRAHHVQDNRASVISTEKSTARTGAIPSRNVIQEIKSSSHFAISAETGSRSSASTLPELRYSAVSVQSQSPDFRKWIADNYGLEVKEVKPLRKREKYSVTAAATMLTLVIILSFTRARLVNPMTAASFLSWMLGGWWYIVCAILWKKAKRMVSKEQEAHQQDITPDDESLDRMSFPEKIICGIPTALLSTWGMVSAIRMLISYYGDCENLQ